MNRNKASRRGKGFPGRQRLLRTGLKISTHAAVTLGLNWNPASHGLRLNVAARQTHLAIPVIVHGDPAAIPLTVIVRRPLGPISFCNHLPHGILCPERSWQGKNGVPAPELAYALKGP